MTSGAVFTIVDGRGEGVFGQEKRVRHVGRDDWPLPVRLEKGIKPLQELPVIEVGSAELFTPVRENVGGSQGLEIPVAAGEYVVDVDSVDAVAYPLVHVPDKMIHARFGVRPPSPFPPEVRHHGRVNGALVRVVVEDQAGALRVFPVRGLAVPEASLDAGCQTGEFPIVAAGPVVKCLWHRRNLPGRECVATGEAP